MLEDLTIITRELQNGVSLTSRYDLKPKANSGFHHSANSIIGRLNKAFIRLGYELVTDGITSCTSSVDGSKQA